MGTEREHHPCSPSTWARLEACPASLAYELQLRKQGRLPPQPAEAATEAGERLHSLALLGDPDMDPELPEDDYDALVAARDWLDGFDELLHDRALIWGPVSEGLLSLGLHLPEPWGEVYGYTDRAWITDGHPVGRGAVLDLKFNRRSLSIRSVYLQQVGYALGIFEMKADVPVEVHIFEARQNRHHFREFTPEQLRTARAFVYDLLGLAIGYTGWSSDGVEKALKPSTEGCRWCRCRSVCPAVQHAIEKTLELPPSLHSAFALHAPGGPERAAKLLDLADMASHWADGVRASLRDWGKEISRERGFPPAVPGWSFYQGKPSRKIRDARVLGILGARLGDAAYDTATVWYGKARDALAQAIAKDFPTKKAAREAASMMLKNYSEETTPEPYWRKSGDSEATTPRHLSSNAAGEIGSGPTDADDRNGKAGAS